MFFEIWVCCVDCAYWVSRELEKICLKEHGFFTQKWHLGLANISVFDLLARNVHRHVMWCIIKVQSFQKITKLVAQVCGMLTGSQELTVCLQAQNNLKQCFLEVLGLLLRRAALPWMKASGWVRFTTYGGCVCMWPVQVFDVTTIWGLSLVALVVLLIYAYRFQAVFLLGQPFQAK